MEDKSNKKEDAEEKEKRPLESFNSAQHKAYTNDKNASN